MDTFSSIIDVLDEEYHCAMDNLSELAIYGPIYSVNLGMLMNDVF